MSRSRGESASKKRWSRAHNHPNQGLPLKGRLNPVQLVKAQLASEKSLNSGKVSTINTQVLDSCKGKILDSRLLKLLRPSHLRASSSNLR